MSARKTFITIVLFAAAIEWALWTGGQFFNLLMVVPGWSDDVPKTIQLYQQNMLSHDIAYFFMVVNPVFLIVPVIIAWLLSLKIESSFRKWFGIAVLLDLIITLVVGLWMAPTARGIFHAAAHGGMELSTMISALHTWKVANTCRVGLEIITLFFFLVSIAKLNAGSFDKKRPYIDPR